MMSGAAAAGASLTQRALPVIFTGGKHKLLQHWHVVSMPWGA